MIPSPDISLDQYFISSDHGFLPAGFPLQKLDHSYYAPWENLAAQLPSLIQTGQIRHLIDDLPVLRTTWLQTEPEWRRAYSILGFLTHAYVWGGGKPKDVSPQPAHSSYLPQFNSKETSPDPPAMHLKPLSRNLLTPRTTTMRNLRSPHPLELHRTPRNRHHRPRQSLPTHLFHGNQRRRMVHRHLRRHRSQRRSAGPAHAGRNRGSHGPRRAAPHCPALQIHRRPPGSHCHSPENV